MTQYAQELLPKYLDDLASKQETPGGGSVCALVGSLAAGLGTMVCCFTEGKKKYADVEDDIQRIHKNCETTRAGMLELMQEDVNVFQNQMGAAYGLPKDTDEQKAARNDAIQAACKAASQPPLEICRLCRDLLKDMGELAEKGSVMLVSDVGVAVSLAQGAFEGASLNIIINLNYLSDENFKKPLKAELLAMTDEVSELAESASVIVQDKLSK